MDCRMENAEVLQVISIVYKQISEKFSELAYINREDCNFEADKRIRMEIKYKIEFIEKLKPMLER